MKNVERTADHSINPIFLNRWSPRAMTGQPFDDETINCLFEAARWAPSSYNGQPWRFIYAKRDTPSFETIFNLLAEPNKVWCKNAAMLCVVISRKNFEHNEKPAVTHGYDTGSAWENLALEGASRNLVVHGMAGFDYEKAKVDLKIPDVFDVMAMFAAGHQAPKETLPEPVRKMEAPSGRKKIEEIMMEGCFRT